MRTGSREQKQMKLQLEECRHSMRHYDDGPNRAVSEQQYSKAILCLHNKSDVVVGRELGPVSRVFGSC